MKSEEIFTVNRLESLLDYAKNHVPFQQRRAPENHLALEQWPLMTRQDLAAHSLDRCHDLLSRARTPGGYIVASGGTTAEPTYQYYTFEEFTAASRNVASNLMANGMEPGDWVVNYFDFGQLWSAFLLADRALSSLPVTVFSVGYTSKHELALDIIERFAPNAIIGIPSMILDLARLSASRHRQIQIRKVFYGGELVTLGVAEALTSIWGCQLIRSACYASTDVGTIGWQCVHCKAGEHYAFDDTVVEIIDHEIVVTSLNRRAMPIIRYRTGDKGQWVSPSCNCGHGAPIFKLLGRVDCTMIIWGCWIMYDEIVQTFCELRVAFTAIQVQLTSLGPNQFMLVQFESLCQPRPVDPAQFRDKFYESCGGGDLNAIFPRDMLDDHLFFENVPVGTLKRNERTGKVIPIIDSRF